jgi:hypothetical protein
MKNTNIYRQKFEDAKGVFSKRRLKEDRQYNDPPIARTIAMINILVEALLRHTFSLTPLGSSNFCL